MAWANALKTQTAPKSALGKTLHYLLEQCPYLEDDRLEFSNNRAERSIKPFVMGRKDFLFCDTPGGPRSSAVLYSLIETAKETGLGPYRYTQDFIRFHAGGLSGSSRIRSCQDFFAL